MLGLGDTVYERPFVRRLARDYDVFLRTAWPELFEDVRNVACVFYPTKLRTQAKNMLRNRARFRPQFPVTRTIRVVYGISNPYQGIIPDYETVFGVPFEAELFDLPPSVAPVPVTADRPLAVVRPVTVRNEWANPARNCLPAYIHEAVAILRERFHVVSVADVIEGGEWFDGAPPQADSMFHRGELVLSALLALVRHAAVIVGPVGWIAPTAVAAKRPLVLIAGGQGAWNGPELLYTPAMDTSRVRWIMPDNYCRCAPAWHECDKTITDFAGQFRAALETLVPERLAA